MRDGTLELFMEIILVTGANRGIGLALTKVLVANGDTVIAACRRPEESSELKQLTLLHPEAIDLVIPEGTQPRNRHRT